MSYITKTKYAASSIPNASAGKVNEFVDTDGVTKSKDETGAIQTYSGSAAVAAHVASPDPHPQYLTASEGNALYDQLGTAAIVQGNLDTHTSDNNNPHSTTKTQVGLGNVDNTSDLDKPISNATQAALVLKYDASNPSNYQTDSQVSVSISAAIAALVNSSPATLDTLAELAVALGNDPNFATTINTALGNRLRVDTAAQGLSGAQKTNAKTNLDLQNVDNTSDLDKPISNATQAALNNKENLVTATTTDDYYRGDKVFANLPSAVRASLLTGLLFSDFSDVVATDTVLQGIGKLQAQNNLWAELVVTSQVNNTSSTTLASLTELSFPVVNGKRYRIEAMFIFQSVATATGLALTMGNTGATGELALCASMQAGGDGTGAIFSGAITAFGDVVTATTSTAANTSLIAKIEGVFVCTTSGTLTPQFRSEINGNQVSIRAGSNILVREF